MKQVTNIKELHKYSYNGYFPFTLNTVLSTACTAPSRHGGIYIIYAQKGDILELMYIGRSGSFNKAMDKFVPRKDGIKGRIVRGKRDKEQRKTFWVGEMQKNQIDVLHFYWFVTYDGEAFLDIPEQIETQLIKKYSPIWNRK